MEAMKEVKEQFKSTLNGVSNDPLTKNLMSSIEEMSNEVYKEVVGFAKKYPIQTALGALSAAYLIGMVMRHRR